MINAAIASGLLIVSPTTTKERMMAATYTRRGPRHKSAGIAKASGKKAPKVDDLVLTERLNLISPESRASSTGCVSEMIKDLKERSTVPVSLHVLRTWSVDLLQKFGAQGLPRESLVARIRAGLLEKLRDGNNAIISGVLERLGERRLKDLLSPISQRALLLSYFEGLGDKESSFLVGIPIEDYRYEKRNLMKEISAISSARSF